MTAPPAQVHVHPSALCESERVGPGTRIWAFAHVMEGATIGRECNIGDHAFVEAGARIGDRVTVKNGVLIWEGVEIEDEAFIGPGVVFSNDRHPRSPRMTMPAVTERYRERERWLLSTRVCQGASIGAGAIVLPGVTLGAHCMIGAGAIVAHDVLPHRLVVGGHPDRVARAAGWVCACGVPLQEAGECQWKCPCGLTYVEDDSGRLAPR